MKKKFLTTLMLVLFLALAGAGSAIGDEYAGAINVFKASPEVQPFFNIGRSFA